MRTQTIRCGYSLWPPFLAKDPNSGQLSGIFYDYLEALGSALHLKIDWTETVGLGDFPAALESGRIDAMCLTIWPNASRAREIDFTNPIFYTALYAYARSDDPRFDNNYAAINDPRTMITVIDGEMGALVAASDFPKAKTLQLPQLADATELFANVAAGKADILFADPGTFAKYEINNPNKIHRVTAKAPIRVFGNTLAIDKGQEEYRRMLNTAIGELLSSGQIEKIITKYEQAPGTYLRVALPYQAE
jgi:ABC-type amino acid transport substrate-binding protein